MRFEIIIEGPLFAMQELHGQLEGLSPVWIRKRKWKSDGEKGGILRVESCREDRLNDRLRFISNAVSLLEKRRALEGAFRLEARNLSYTEPLADTGAPDRAYHPIPSMTVQRWHPNLNPASDSDRLLLYSEHAFGSGKHPTTRLCLEGMEQIRRQAFGPFHFHEAMVLDFGCGSGILAMAAAKMGARQVKGVDRDPDAVRDARFNVEINRLQDRVCIVEGSWEALDKTHALMLANLVPAVFTRAGDQMGRYLNGGGLAVLSGFGIAQAHEIRALSRRAGLRVVKRLERDAWCAFILQKPAA